MGYALAKAAVARDWKVDLISGPVSLSAPKEARLHSIETAEQLRNSLIELFPQCDVLLMAAAVSDFRPAKQLKQKEKKHEARRSLDLVPTTDCLLELGLQKSNRILVGFAAETENLEENGLRKLREKNLDWIAVNQVGPGIGFQSDYNQILLLDAKGSRHPLGPGPKTALANDLLDLLKLSAQFDTCSA